MKNRRIIHKALCILLAAVMLIPMFAACAPSLEDPEPSVLSTISMTPQKADEAGVAYDSGFLITAKVALSQRELEQNLTVEPEFKYSISSTEGGYILKPAQPLLENTVYAFTLGTKEGRTRTWAFQTRRPFGIISSTPANGSSDVSNYTGIELVTSHYGVDLSGYLKIDPPVEGQFDSRGYTTVFYPNQGFTPNTKYTVTVKKGLESPFGDILPEDYTFSFTTMEGDGSNYGKTDYGKTERPIRLYGDFSETFLSTDTPLVELGVSEGNSGKTLTTAVYKFSGSDKYAEAIAAHDQYIKDGGLFDEFSYPTDTLEHLVSFDSTPVMKGGYSWGTGYVVFDKPLPKGCYLLNISVADDSGKTVTVQKLLQVSDISVYTQSLNGETLVWLNSAVDGQPINAAGVGVLKAGEKAPTVSATTDKDGIAVLSTKSFKEAYLLAKVDAENEFVDKIPLAEYTEPKTSELYYSYLYKDREVYMPTDTINFWGRITPRKDGVKMPAALKAEFTVNDYTSPASPEKVILSVPVTLQPNGTFTAKLAIDSIQSDWYTLSITDEAGKEYCSSGFRVYEYEKPLYTFEVSSQKPFYTSQDKIDFNLKSTFYNGTPAPNLTFEARTDNTGTKKVTTDLTGTALAYYNENKQLFADVTTWDPRYLNVYFTSTGMEDQYYDTQGSTLVFPRDTMLQVEKVKNGYRNDVNITTNRVDTSRIKSADEVWTNYPKNITGAAVNIPVTVSVFRVDYIKEYLNSYYDPLNKKTVPFYTYRTQETLENQYTVNTLNGKATLSNLPNPKNGEQYYYIELKCQDTAGLKITDSVYIGYYENREDYMSDLKYYRYANMKENENDYVGQYRYWYNDGSNASYEIGESVDIQMLENSKPAPAQGTMLYTILQDKIIDMGVAAGQSTFSFTEAEKHLPNITIAGAYFDGRHVYPVSACEATFNPEAREVDITVTPDKPDYRPGDEVSLAITAKGKDGKPVQGDMVVSVADEAVFAIAPQYADPVQSLYQSVYYYNIVSFASYVQHSFYDNGGGKGGGGGGEVRRDFKDTAIFLPTQTDANGNASLKFTLPDNLTSWRVTTLSVADSGKLVAGANVTNINAKLPLFVSPVYNTTYIEGDDIAFNVRAYGDKVVNITSVDFTATVTGINKVNEELKTTNTADEYALFNFGKLKAGDYKATFRAQVGEDTDAVEYPFTVKQSGLEMQVTHEVAPNEVSSLAPLRYPVWLGFYDSQYKDYMQTLNNLLGSDGERADQQVAYDVASKLMRQYSEDEDILPASEPTDFTYYQDLNGGVKTYSYDFPDVQLTARAAAAAPELFNTEAMIKYFNRFLANGSGSQLTDVSAAIMGLAALKQPVLTDAKTMLKKADVLIDLDFLYLTAALAYLGDTDAAQKAYDTYIAPSIVSNEMWSYYDVTVKPRPVNDQFEGYQQEDDIQSTEGGGKGGSMTQDALTQTGANLKRTALAMLIAMKLQHSDTEKLLAYIRDNSAYDVATLLEQTAYVNGFVPKTTDTAVVAFNKGLFPTNLELKKDGIRFVPFNKDQLGKANITVKNGNVGIIASYIGVPSNLSDKPSPDISIEKTITTLESDTLKPGGLVQVRIDVHLDENAPVGIYDLSEWIPSSLRYDSVRYTPGLFGGIWLDAREEQRLTMRLYRSGRPVSVGDETPKQRTDYSFTYYARCVTEGDCKIDSTTIVNRASGAVAYTKVGDVLSVKNGFKESVTKSKE